MKTTLSYDGERGAARLDIVKEVHHDLSIHELTSQVVDCYNLKDALVHALDFEDDTEADDLLDNDDIRRGLLLMVAHEIINHISRY